MSSDESSIESSTDGDSDPAIETETVTETSVPTLERLSQYLRCFIVTFLIVTLVSLLNQFGVVPRNGFKSASADGSVSTTDMITDATPLPLRYDWGNLDLQSPFAKQMSAHQENCSLPLIKFRQRYGIGIGSDLHVWTQALCNAMEINSRLWTPPPWEDAGPNGTCDGGAEKSAINCLFPNAELRCPQDAALTANESSSDSIPWLFMPKNLSLPHQRGCNQTLSRGHYTSVDLRTTGIEYLFSRITADVIHEAERRLGKMFPDGVPKDLITVHVRWGDKLIKEMERVSVENYTLAIQNLLERRPERSPVNIFLATEDPQAVKQFREAAKLLNWTLFVDPYVREMKRYYRGGINNNPKMTKKLQGKPAISALASLLISLEANTFVLVTKSNWSRMINELRQAVIDPRCGNCTTMTDLSYEEGWR
jgi:hypothetical protein